MARTRRKGVATNETSDRKQVKNRIIRLLTSHIWKAADEHLINQSLVIGIVPQEQSFDSLAVSISQIGHVDNRWHYPDTYPKLRAECARNSQSFPVFSFFSFPSSSLGTSVFEAPLRDLSGDRAIRG